MTPGQQTTEYQLTQQQLAANRLQAYAGIALVALGAALEVLQQLEVLFPGQTWIGAALIVLGVLVKIAAAVTGQKIVTGYQASRAQVKQAEAWSATGKPPPL